MAKIKFRDIRLAPSNKKRLDIINQIVEEYQQQGYKLTLRQLYYQLVSRDVIPNQQKEYAKVSKLLKEGRMSGIVDWDAIEDRLRQPSSPSSWDNPAQIIDSCLRSYELPRMRSQKTYIEVWVEKDALSGVLKRVTEKYHIPILVNRGYSSASAMYDAYNRFNNGFALQQQAIRILYLGDYDPSGMDMIRDVEHRILEFFAGDNGYDHIDAEDYKRTLRDQIGLDFEIIPIALTRAQITKYNPPPNPAKRSDPRAGKFIAERGSTSWEVDALPPNVLNAVLTSSIEDLIDVKLYKSIVSMEKKDIKKIESLKQYL